MIPNTSGPKPRIITEDSINNKLVEIIITDESLKAIKTGTDFKILEGKLTDLLLEAVQIKSETLRALINTKIDIVVKAREKQIGW